MEEELKCFLLGSAWCVVGRASEDERILVLLNLHGGLVLRKRVTRKALMAAACTQTSQSTEPSPYGSLLEPQNSTHFAVLLIPPS